MTPTVREVKADILREELSVPGAVMVRPKGEKGYVSAQWYPSRPESCAVVMALLVKHKIKFGLIGDEDGDVDLMITEPKTLRNIRVVPSAWILYDGTELTAFEDFYYKRDWEAM